MSLTEAFKKCTQAQLLVAGAMILTGLAVSQASRGHDFAAVLDSIGVAVFGGAAWMRTKIAAREADNAGPKKPAP